MKKRTGQDWLSHDILCLTDARRKLKPNRRASSVSNKHYNFLCCEIKRKCNKNKEHYLKSICVQVESAHAQKKSRKVYDAVRKITEKPGSRVWVVKNKKGVTLTDQEKVKDSWLEHFHELYNPSSQTVVSVMQEIPIHQLVVDTTPSLPRAEVESAIYQLKQRNPQA